MESCTDVLSLADSMLNDYGSELVLYEHDSCTFTCNGHVYSKYVVEMALSYFENRHRSMYLLDEDSEVFYSIAEDVLRLIEDSLFTPSDNA